MTHLMNARTVADRLGVHVATLNRMRKKGLIRCHLLGYNTVRYSEEQVQEYIDNPLTVKTKENQTGGKLNG